MNGALNAGTHDELGSGVFDNEDETLSNDYRVTIPTGIDGIDETLEGGIGKGDIIIFVCAILFALHIMYIDKVGKAFNGVDLSAFQFLTAGIICLIIGSFVETTTLSNIKAALIPILYAGIGSCGIAYTLQVVGQKYVQPAKATLALSLESAWSVVGGAIILGETMSPRELFGCLILFVAVVIAQLPEKKKA